MERERSEKQTGRGWGVAALIVGLAIAANLTVYYIHTTTSSRKPIDVNYRTHGGE